MSNYYEHLFVSPLLEEEKKLKYEHDEDNDNILVRGIRGFSRAVGKGLGHISRWTDEGFSKGYKYNKGVKHIRKLGVEESADCLYGCDSIGDSLYRNNVNGTFFGDREDSGRKNYSLFNNRPGEDWGRINEPAFRAARTVNSTPHPMVAYNGISNIKEDMEPFSLRNYRR